MYCPIFLAFQAVQKRSQQYHPLPVTHEVGYDKLHPIPQLIQDQFFPNLSSKKPSWIEYQG